MYTGEQTEYKAVDFDALFTAFCLCAILAILELTPTRGLCTQPFVLWFSLKALTLILRLALKAGFPQYSSRSWFKLLLALIKLFSICWIIYGITMLVLEDHCTTDDTFYLGVLGFIIVFAVGAVVLFAVFVLTYLSLKASDEDEEKTEIKSRLVV
jgi:hypothetical protein